MSESSPKNNIGNTIRLILFPGLISVLSLLIWRGVDDLQDDVSVLLADNNAQKIQINYLEKQVENLNRKVYNISYVPDHQIVPRNLKDSSGTIAFYIRPEGTKKEIFDIRDYIKFT